jgi:DNA-directed RNA polymerase subunit RPC12/RpoP
VVALDGNSIAGLLATVCGTELTTATGACASCRRRSIVGELTVYLRGPGTVIRCPHCGGVVMILVKTPGVTCVDLRGLGALERAGRFDNSGG